MADKGVSVNVQIIYPENKAYENKTGNFEGVNYEFLGNYEDYYGGVFSKIKNRFLGLYRIGDFIFKKRIDVVVTYHDNWLTNLYVALITKLLTIPFILDKTEYPYGYFKMSKFRRLLENFNLKLFDGFIVISNELEKFYKDFSKNIFLLPMTIDPNRFDNIEVNSSSNNYIALTFGTHNRDNIYDSVRSYELYTRLKSDEEPYDLYLIGDFDELIRNFPENQSIEKYIVDYKLSNKIFFLGKKPIHEVPQILVNAKCLLTTPLTYVSGGFPTKLGEYMLSGVPVVASNAGEISSFVKDRFDILLSKVGDNDSIASNILLIHNNPFVGKEIAENAIKTAKSKFNAATYVDEMVSFFNKLKK